ncbi:hypothetical protein B0A64_13850 [Flavobacterium araucananum]|uniref:Uncharacterized protein n=1 Tax=Flavobacterium araucananum TaxID=946678 RepID=A0A227P796_9FLAO|nr:hypothetical protein B0A64_13850 [Flavobacterium araucananum]
MKVQLLHPIQLNYKDYNYLKPQDVISNSKNPRNINSQNLYSKMTTTEIALLSTCVGADAGILSQFVANTLKDKVTKKNKN